ncbi:dynamin family protein [Allobranchiibius sp. CTAmp26]|uniref:dynamin family protein n=1 Tax=Allobranchiibius sp. CTAmp26 TaxID=2815214 RepID=UPI001AA19426|nr:dynamin family protein [Allobranchiibius sp. CTAmp26]MBO1755988.1 dynamin family protein [Allobranchiibius sp. CTAmp26]
MTRALEGTVLLPALQSLRTHVEQTALPLDVEGVAATRRTRSELLAQLDDYLIPRAKSLDAPLLAVVGGSTGAGKSTLVNSIVGEHVSKSGVLRPTTLASTLVHNPADEGWFAGDRVLPGLARLTGEHTELTDPGTLHLVSSPGLPQGVALLDAPDIDSVVSANRDLARQLMSAADLWIFVTTAARYADAVPWELLHQATDRGTSVAVVLNRVPTDAMEDVRSHFAGMLAEQGLGQSPVFAIIETGLEDGRLPDEEVARLRSWLNSLASDAQARNIVIRRTLDGALDSLQQRVRALQDGIAAQSEGAARLRKEVDDGFAAATSGVDEGMKDGSLLRGEVLARWHEFVGTGEVLRQLERHVGRARDRVTAYVRGRGKAQPADELGEALQSGVVVLVRSHGQSAVDGIARGWRLTPGGAPLIGAHPEIAQLSPDFTQRAEELVRRWQGEVLQMVRDEAAGKRTTARFLAFGVNGLAVMLMLLAFSATYGLSGAEIGIAGGSAVVAQRLLEALFGDQAVRTLSTQARKRLLDLSTELYEQERTRYLRVLEDGATISPEDGGLRTAMGELKAARR